MECDGKAWNVMEGPEMVPEWCWSVGNGLREILRDIYDIFKNVYIFDLYFRDFTVTQSNIGRFQCFWVHFEGKN